MDVLPEEYLTWATSGKLAQPEAVALARQELAKRAASTPAATADIPANPVADGGRYKPVTEKPEWMSDEEWQFRQNHGE